MSIVDTLFSLSGRVAVVTGASSGIGRALAEGYAAAGASVVLVARRADKLDEAVATIRAAGGAAEAVAGDLSDRAQLGTIAAKAAVPFGAPQIVLSAAGTHPRQHADTITPEAWDRTIELNLNVPFLFARQFVPAMKAKGWGRVINIASLQSVRAFVNGIAYGATKGGIVQLTRAMAEAWSPHGIMCNAIAPGFFPTELTAPVFADPEWSKRLADQTMVGRNGRLDDLQGLAIFLAAPASDYITGQTIFCDGGFTAK